MSVWIEVDDSIQECGEAEVASWAAQAVEERAVVDEFNPPRPEWPEFVQRLERHKAAGMNPTEARSALLAELDDESSVVARWMQHFFAEDIEGGEYPDLEMTHLVTDLKTNEHFYLMRTREWEA